MRITESHLRRIIREVIIENNETLNEGAFKEGWLIPLLLSVALTKCGQQLKHLNIKLTERATVEFFLKNPGAMRHFENAKNYEHLIEKAKELDLPGLKIQTKNDADALVKYVENSMREAQHKNQTKYSGPSGGMSSPDAPVSEQ